MNELSGGAETAAYLVKYDSIHGTWDKDVEFVSEESGFTVDGKAVSFSAKASIEDVPWAALGVDIVCDCTGKFLTKAKLQPYLDAGVKRIVVSAPVKEDGVRVGFGDDLQ